MKEKTKDKGLSLGDRAYLALAMFHNYPVMTANKAWAELHLVVEAISVR